MKVVLQATFAILSYLLDDVRRWILDTYLLDVDGSWTLICWMLLSNQIFGFE